MVSNMIMPYGIYEDTSSWFRGNIEVNHSQINHYVGLNVSLFFLSDYDLISNKDNLAEVYQ